jgi:hypothetical protein
VGFADSSKAFWYYNAKLQRIMKSHNVIFDENVFTSTKIDDLDDLLLKGEPEWPVEPSKQVDEPPELPEPENSAPPKVPGSASKLAGANMTPLWIPRAIPTPPEKSHRIANIPAKNYREIHNASDKQVAEYEKQERAKIRAAEKSSKDTAHVAFLSAHNLTLILTLENEP